MRAFYNEIDTYCCDWLSNLMDAGHITPGVICDKSIEDVFPDELRGFDRCHFFAGIGVWDYALNLAGWGKRPVWTGSAPCQPFSAAGKGLGFADERHLWPAWHWLIQERGPAIVFGEQVANGGGIAWLEHVRIDFEQSGYAFAAADIEAAACGSEQARERIFFVADGDFGRRKEPRLSRETESILVGNSRSCRNGSHASWTCRDGRDRRIESGLLPVASRFAGWMEQIRAYGNAINAQAAAEFIRAAREAIE